MRYVTEDAAFLKLVDPGASGWGTLIACLYRGPGEPPYCEGMARSPVPETGFAVGPTIVDEVLSALRINPAVHDGAMMLRLDPARGRYRLEGWSYRLFPPAGQIAGAVNRGSAFNSCLAMSLVERVDCLYLVSKNSLTRFEDGNHHVIR
jgi:hypothetical protein